MDKGPKCHGPRGLVHNVDVQHKELAPSVWGDRPSVWVACVPAIVTGAADTRSLQPVTWLDTVATHIVVGCAAVGALSLGRVRATL